MCRLTGILSPQTLPKTTACFDTSDQTCRDALIIAMIPPVITELSFEKSLEVAKLKTMLKNCDDKNVLKEAALFFFTNNCILKQNLVQLVKNELQTSLDRHV